MRLTTAALRKFPDKILFRILLGYAMHAGGLTGEALRNASRVVHQDPSLPESLAYRATILLRNKQPRLAAIDVVRYLRVRLHIMFTIAKVFLAGECA